MKRFLFLLFVVTFVLSFVGCSDDDDDGVAVYVHVYADLTEDIYYNGTYYAGRGITNDPLTPRYNTDYWPGIQVSSPTVKGFAADGCFVLRGSVDYTGSEQYALVKVINTSTADAIASSYWVRGNFKQRIWLRSGPGLYKVSVYKTDMSGSNLNYNGALSGYTPAFAGAYNFFVTNTRAESGAYYYPSGPIQSDDPQIKSIAKGLVDGITDETSQVRAIHDYVVRLLNYDFASIDEGQRKKQDALSCLNNETAICEGYALLFSALARSVGIRSKYITGSVTCGLHAWSAIEVDGNWSFVDTTWDDPCSSSGTSDNLSWDYFMKDAATFAFDHTWESENVDRSLATKQVVYELKGYPRGSY